MSPLIKFKIWSLGDFSPIKHTVLSLQKVQVPRWGMTFADDVVLIDENVFEGKLERWTDVSESIGLKMSKTKMENTMSLKTR